MRLDFHDVNRFIALITVVGCVSSRTPRQATFGGELPKWGAVSVYTFGAPRVGNSAFAAYFESLFVGREVFRIVNDRDIVARLPRSGNAAGAVVDYEHVGKTVLIAEEQPEPPPREAAGADGGDGGAFGGFWVEGESDEAACPLRDVSPLSNPFSSGNVLGDVSAQTKDFATSAWSKIQAADKVRSRSDLKKAVEEGMSEFESTKASIAKRIGGMSAGEALSLFGLDKDFVDSELKMVESLAQGKAIEHHLEPSYFVAMTQALDAALEDGGRAAAAAESEN